MSVGRSLFTHLNLACYHLDLLKCDVDEIKEPSKKPPHHSSSADILTVAIQSLKLFQETLTTITPPKTRKVQVLLPSIIEKADLLLEKIKKRVITLSNSKNPLHTTAEAKLLEELQTTVIDCKKTIETTKKTLANSNPIPTQTGTLLDELLSCAKQKLGQKTGDIGIEWLKSEAIQPKLQKVQKSIQKYTTKLHKDSGSDIPVNFADTLSVFITTYLKEQILHVNDREPALRPPFLEKFFNNLYADNLRKEDPENSPTCTALGSAIIPLLQDEDTVNLITDCIRLNLLKALSQGLGTIYSLKENNPFFVTHLFDTVFSTTVNHVSHEIDSKSAGDHGINLLTVEERDQILSTTFQKGIVSSILSFAFPKGSSDLKIPDVLLDIPGKEYLKNYLKKELAWNNLTELLEDLTAVFFIDLSKNDDVKKQLLIKAYQEANILLSGIDPNKKAPLISSEKNTTTQKAMKPLSTISLISIGIITTIFHIIIESIKNVIHNRNEPKKFTYPQQNNINLKIEKTMLWLTKGSKFKSFFVKHFGKEIAESIGTNTVRTLEEIDVKEFINEQLASITEIISPSNNQKFIPRTATDEFKNEQNLKDERAKNADDLKDLRTDFGNNFNGIIKSFAENFYPTESYKNEANRLYEKIHYFCRCFLQTCIRNFISFFLWTIDARRITKELEQKSFQITKTIDQDALLMAISQKALERLKSFPTSPPPPPV